MRVRSNSPELIPEWELQSGLIWKSHYYHYYNYIKIKQAMPQKSFWLSSNLCLAKKKTLQSYANLVGITEFTKSGGF